MERIMSIQDWYIVALSMLPLTELRATIPLAITLGIVPWRAFVLAVSGNLIPILPILLLLGPLERGLSRFPRVQRILQRVLQKTRGKGEQVKKYGVIGLALFVAIPLPGTGAWTGATLAWLFGISTGAAFGAISIGVLIAGLIVTLATLGIVKVLFFYKLEYLLGVLLILILVFFWRRKKKVIK